MPPSVYLGIDTDVMHSPDKMGWGYIITLLPAYTSPPLPFPPLPFPCRITHMIPQQKNVFEDEEEEEEEEEEGHGCEGHTTT